MHRSQDELVRPRLDLSPELGPIRGLVGASSGADDAVPVWESPGPGYLVAAVASVDSEVDDEPAMANHAAAQLLDTLSFQGPELLVTEPQDGILPMHFQHIGDDEVDALALDDQSTSMASLMLDSVQQRVRLLWGGKARAFFLDANALHRLTFDDIPLPEVDEGEPQRFLRTVDVCPSTPGIFLACTPGAYSTWTASWVFEQALISAFRLSENWSEWTDTIHRSLSEHSSRGASFVVIPWGASSYLSVREDILGPGGQRLCDRAAQQSRDGGESWLQAWLGIYGPVHERWRLALAQVPDDGASHERALQSNQAEMELPDVPDDVVGERPPGWEQVASSLQMLSAEWSINQQGDTSSEQDEGEAEEFPPLLPGGLPTAEESDVQGSSGSDENSPAVEWDEDEMPVIEAAEVSQDDTDESVDASADLSSIDRDMTAAVFDDSVVGTSIEDSVNEYESETALGEALSAAAEAIDNFEADGDEVFTGEQFEAALDESTDDEKIHSSERDTAKDTSGMMLLNDEDGADADVEDSVAADLALGMDSDTIRIPSPFDAAQEKKAKENAGTIPAQEPSLVSDIFDDIRGEAREFYEEDPSSDNSLVLGEAPNSDILRSFSSLAGPGVEQAPPDIPSGLFETTDLETADLEDDISTYTRSRPWVWATVGAFTVFAVAGLVRLAGQDSRTGTVANDPTNSAQAEIAEAQVGTESKSEESPGNAVQKAESGDQASGETPPLGSGVGNGSQTGPVDQAGTSGNANIADGPGVVAEAEGALESGDDSEFETIHMDEPEDDDEVVSETIEPEAVTKSSKAADKPEQANPSKMVKTDTESTTAANDAEIADKAEVQGTLDAAKPVASEPAKAPLEKAQELDEQQSETVPDDGFYVRAQAYLVLRKRASARSRKLWVIPDNAVVRIIGRREGTRWIRVQYQHRTGWIAWVKKRVLPVNSEFTLDDLDVVAP